MALPIPPPPLIGLSGQPMSYSEVGAALLQNSPSSHSTNIVEDAYLNKQITPLLIILDKLGLLKKAIILCFQGLGSDDIIERSKHGNKEQKQSVQQKPVAASGDPNKHDFNKDDDKYKKKDKQKEQKTETENSFDPKKEGNYDKAGKHNKYGKFYRDAQDNRVWYSKEVSGDRGHGGIHWKKYREIGGRLNWEADVDITGKVMDKGGNTVRRVIRLKDFKFY